MRRGREGGTGRTWGRGRDEWMGRRQAGMNTQQSKVDLSVIGETILFMFSLPQRQITIRGRTLNIKKYNLLLKYNFNLK